MDVFSDVYDKSVDMLKAPQFHADWAIIEKGLKNLLQAGGPSATSGAVLDELRAHLADAARKAGGAKGKATGAEIVRASQPAKPDFQDRAALIKQMKHFYMVEKKGSQSVWVVDNPRSYPEWSYLMFDGKNAVDLPALLSNDEEVFGRAHRQMMSGALQLARKWSADTEIKLSSKSTDDAIRRWFLLSGASDADVGNVRAILQTGFRQITAACNSGKVIFSDRPHLRMDSGYDFTFASTNGADDMPVIYIYDYVLKTTKRNLKGPMPKLWTLALTIVHELSHKLMGTEDKRYDDDGLKPSVIFPPAFAIINADSWAYFCGDTVGAVPKSAILAALK